MADAIAGQSQLEPLTGLMVYHCNSEDVHAALVPPGTWLGREGMLPFHGSLARRTQRTRFLQYTQKRDEKNLCK
jgi:hypothetical protein